MSRWTLEVKKGEDDYVVELPDDLIKETGWKIGDTLKWIDNQGGSWTLTKEL